MYSNIFISNRVKSKITVTKSPYSREGVDIRSQDQQILQTINREFSPKSVNFRGYPTSPHSMTFATGSGHYPISHLQPVESIAMALEPTMTYDQIASIFVPIETLPTVLTFLQNEYGNDLQIDWQEQPSNSYR